ncbi:MAG TPA: pitrilysin family protein [Candidatus Eisenbacteria bacterium]|jgi:predicted Zn-dependent peptidase
MGESDYQKSVLTSGITLVTERVPGRHSVAVGVWVRSGARDEPFERLGISHFIEHMMFKGTERRDARAIAQSLESLGGHLDAFTAREQVCYFARALAEHLPQVVDVISDIVCRSRFAAPEVEREKSVVREEIFACEDDPEDKINDLLAEQIWGEHALGRPILGTVETVERLDPETLRDYFRRRYRPEDLLVAAAGALEHGQVAELVERHFAPPDGEGLPFSGPPPGFEPSVRHEVRAGLQQLYLSLGTRGLPYAGDRRFALIVLHTLLGGGMSSRLFQSVREEAGLAYSVYTAADFHRDSGMFSIHLGVSPQRGREALGRVRDELRALCAEGPSEAEVEAARGQIRGGLLMAQESVSSRMYQIAHDELYHGRYVPAEEQVASIMAVTREDVAKAAGEFAAPERFALTALGPAAGEPLGERDWPVAGAARQEGRATATA